MFHNMTVTRSVAVGTPSGRDDQQTVQDSLIAYLTSKIKTLNYVPGKDAKEVSASDIAFVSGQTDIINQLRVLQAHQKNQKESANGLPVRQSQVSGT